MTSDFYTKDFFSFEKYVSIQRWISYFHQVNEALKLVKQNGSVLLIGKGDNIVSIITGLFGVNVTTFDYSADLSPDVLGDVNEIKKHFNENSFDLIICCQVLEHLEYTCFNNILSQFSKIAPYTLLSLPWRHVDLLTGWLKIHRNILKPMIVIPRFWEKNFSSSQHFWEIDVKNYSAKKVRSDIVKHFDIVKEFSDSINPYHRFFILKTKPSQ